MGIMQSKSTSKSQGHSAESTCTKEGSKTGNPFWSCAVMESFMDLPIVVIQNILSHLPARDLIAFRKVCKAWKEEIDSISLWKEKCARDLGADYLPRGLVLPVHELQRIYVKEPFRRNLLKNWDATEGLKHWRVENGGHRAFQIEAGVYAAEMSTITDVDVEKCWATSYSYGSKVQTIDLLKNGCPLSLLKDGRINISASVWTAARLDCGSVFNAVVTVVDNKSKEIHSEKRTRTVAQWQDNSWVKLSWSFPAVKAKEGCYPQFVSFTHGGKDTQFWAGYYGSKMAAPSVSISIVKASESQ